MPHQFLSLVQRLATAGKVRPVSAEAEARLHARLRARYVPAAIMDERENRIAADLIRDIPLRQ